MTRARTWSLTAVLWCSACPAWAQSSLALSGTSLTFTAGSGVPVSGVEWTFSGVPTAFTVSLGPAAAGKTLNCSSMTTYRTMTCIVVGMNTTAMQTGVIATVSTSPADILSWVTTSQAGTLGGQFCALPCAPQGISYTVQ